jgi:hypothetical protein
MRAQGISPVSEVRHLRRLLAAFVSVEPKLNIHRNNDRKFSREIQRYEAVNGLHEKSASGCPVECRGITSCCLTFTSTPVPKAGAFNDSYVVELRLELDVVQSWATFDGH